MDGGSVSGPFSAVAFPYTGSVPTATSADWIVAASLGYLKMVQLTVTISEGYAYVCSESAGFAGDSDKGDRVSESIGGALTLALTSAQVNAGWNSRKPMSVATSSNSYGYGLSLLFSGCTQGCLTCSASVCLRCSDDYRLHQGSCTLSCPVGKVLRGFDCADSSEESIQPTPNPTDVFPAKNWVVRNVPLLPKKSQRYLRK